MIVTCAVSMVCTRTNASAIPIFAQRYLLSCKTCHSVLPVLNSFGQAFRDRGYRLPLPTHGTTVVAIRYQYEWERDPAPGTNRFSPAGVLLSSINVGAITAFVHYNLGAGGGPSALFLGYLATYNAHTRSLYRGGLFELPLAQSPGQRLDDLTQYGYYGAHVGLNNLALSAPRWGLQTERTIGVLHADATVSLGEFQGSAYGGRPLPTGETTWANTPELGLFVRAPLNGFVEVGGEAMTGTRHIVPSGRSAFDDGYSRYGLLLRSHVKSLDLQAEQWWGRDADSDGFNTVTGSSGGYARLTYWINPHAYVAVRYDAQATPALFRDFVYYGAFQVTPHIRLLLQQQQIVGGTGHLGAAFTVGFPWPLKE
ncbi:MAG: hypothetical protein ACXVAM_16050 [Vulcanimicrobiaceae bacterium]